MRPVRHTRHTSIVGAATLALALTITGSSGALAETARLSPGAAGGVAEVEAALTAAEAAATDASNRALDASAAADEARRAADAATERSADLTTQRDAAEGELAEAAAHASSVAGVLYRELSAGPLVARLLTSAAPETLLTRLALLERVGAVSSRTAGAAREAAAVVTALQEQASAADAERQRLAAEAEAQASRARSQADAETAVVADAQAQLDELYTRLAQLRNTSADAERQARLDRQTAGQTAAGTGTAPAAGTATDAAQITPAAPEPEPEPAPAPAPAPAPIMTPAQAQAHARSAIGAYGWGDDQFTCLVSLWNRESGWRVEARNPSSGAYGIPQAYPAEKLAAAGPDWRTSAATQISWGLSYIKGRHGSPCGAWSHSEQTGWY